MNEKRQRKKPDAYSLPVLMDAALAVYLNVGDHVTEPGEYSGSANIYFDAHRCISYRTRWKLKTKAGATARIRRETIQYLRDLRDQIDELLPRLETAEPDKHDSINVWSQAYDQPEQTRLTLILPAPVLVYTVRSYHDYRRRGHVSGVEAAG